MKLQTKKKPLIDWIGGVGGRVGNGDRGGGGGGGGGGSIFLFITFLFTYL